MLLTLTHFTFPLSQCGMRIPAEKEEECVLFDGEL